MREAVEAAENGSFQDITRQDLALGLLIPAPGNIEDDRELGSAITGCGCVSSPLAIVPRFGLP
ncbi:MAG: hypothetical protein HKP52_01850 [Desulfofustis sp.]|nr:hypothetical protein [Desulfofustis sp.]